MFRTSCRSVVLVISCWLLLSVVSQAEEAGSVKLTRTESELVDAEQQRFKAQIAGDAAALEPALAAELLYTHATGRVQTKGEYLQGFASGKSRYKAVDVVDRVVHVEGDMGMTSGKITLTIGNGMQLVSRFTGVYIKRQGRWELLAWQATDIQSPPSK